MAQSAARRYNDLTVTTEQKEAMRMDTTIPLYGFGGGGGSAGATLTVTAPAGVTVTLTGGGKTKTQTADSGGKAVFRGLETGTWTLTITDGTDTASKTVEITANYTEEIMFFAANLQVVYPAGLVCRATEGGTTLTAPDTTGTWSCTVYHRGTWTFTAGDWSAEVEVAANGQTETVRLARWLVKDGTLTGEGLSNPLISGRSMAPTQETGYVQIRNSLSGQAAGVLSGEAFDLANAGKVIADVDVTTAGSSSSAAKFNGVGLILTREAGYSSLNNAAAGIVHEAITHAAGRQTLTLDAAEVTGAWYVGFAIGVSGNFKVYDLRLEV